MRGSGRRLIVPVMAADTPSYLDVLDSARPRLRGWSLDVTLVSQTGDTRGGSVNNIRGNHRRLAQRATDISMPTTSNCKR